jgi:hypothetical protein
VIILLGCRGASLSKDFCGTRVDVWSLDDTPLIVVLAGHALRFKGVQQYQFDFEAAVTILEAKCAASPLDPTGRVEAGHILVKGWIGPAELIVKEALPTDTSKYTGVGGSITTAHRSQLVYLQPPHGAKSREVILDEKTGYGRWKDGYYFSIAGMTLGRRKGDGRE